MVLVKDYQHNIVGAGNIYFDNENAIIDDIVVLKSACNQGLAKMIMFYLISYVKQLNKQSVLLFGTEIATPIYKKIGFKPKIFICKYFINYSWLLI
ncbi:GNAT family N-acetyltransferase [Mesoplasma chauliocola]|uniref:GNAT family N-acetyltransferase n=1 Tax=Mesoplasma chauliocola TaxID=216427 RepID=A0A249SNQ3_9MOLU|nr:GNAT family N-acetyltransferase [Mesoplasma chauliocola]